MASVPSFTSDCANCVALCCVSFAFDKSEDFAIDKPACTPCPNLTDDNTCVIHETLEADGFSGCARYDCLGAGQRVTHEVFSGQSWRHSPELITPMANAFAALRVVHRDLELLLAARNLTLPAPVAAERDTLIEILAPDDGWSAQSLQITVETGLSNRVSGFLRGLRAFV